MKTTKLLATLLAMYFGLVNAFAQPINNNCVNATQLTIGKTFYTTGTNVGANTESTNIDVGNCTEGQDWVSSGGSNAPNATVWYKFTVTTASTYTISTDNGGDMDTQMKLLTGTCGAWTYIYCDDDSGICNGLAAEITDNLVAGTYYVMIDGYDIEEGQFNISVVDDNATTPNDCINNAISIDNAIGSISASNPFNCKQYCFNNITQDVIGDPNNFTYYMGCHNLLGNNLEEAFFGTWFKFKFDSTKQATWISVHPANTLSCDDSENIFYSLHLFRDSTLNNALSKNCNGKLIAGLSSIDCSVRDGLGANGGDRDKAAGSFMDHPRLDISGLTHNATYYVMVAQIVPTYVVVYDPTGVPHRINLNLQPSEGQYYLTLEAGPVGFTSIDSISSDGFTHASNFTSDTCLTNAGLQGNLWIGNVGTAYPIPRFDEPRGYNGVNILGGHDINCTGLNTFGDALSVLNNNSALYAFDVDTSGFDTLVCYTKDEIKAQIIEIFDGICPFLIFYPLRLPILYDPSGNVIIAIGDSIADLLGDTIYIPSEEDCAFMHAELDLVLTYLLDKIPQDEFCIPVNCSPNVLVTLNNFTACGINGAATVGQLIAVVDSIGTLFAWGTINDTTNCITIRVLSIPPGKYYVVVDGQGSVIKYDLSIDMEYRLGFSGAPCNRQPLFPSANNTQPLNLVSDFNLVYLQPIPATNELQVGYHLMEETAIVSISIFDMTGKEVRTISNIHAQSGINRHTLNIADLNTGLYILSINKGGERIQTRFMKIE